MPTTEKGNARDSGYDRVEGDWYAEHPDMVVPLLRWETFEGPVHDPACGGGNIPNVCLGSGLDASGGDIVDRGWPGTRVEDFLTTTAPLSNVIVNPPYGDELPERFTHHAMELIPAGGKVCVLQLLSWLEGQKRGERLFDTRSLARVWVFRKRHSIPPGGTTIPPKGGSKAYAWFVFVKGYQGPTTVDWLR